MCLFLSWLLFLVTSSLSPSASFSTPHLPIAIRKRECKLKDGECTSTRHKKDLYHGFIRSFVHSFTHSFHWAFTQSLNQVLGVKAKRMVYHAWIPESGWGEGKNEWLIWMLANECYRQGNIEDWMQEILEGLTKLFFGERTWKDFQKGKIWRGNIRKRIF